MQLERLKIRDFRNLRDFEITFIGDSTSPDGESREFKSHAVIGQNGSGKSNMIEAIVTIFRDLDLNPKEGTSFGYELDYTCRGHRIEIKAMSDKSEVTIIDNDTKKSKTQALSYLQRYAKRYLPSHVFAYYSGRNERIESIFQDHQRRFSNALREGSDELLRRLFYCRTVHSQFVLLAYLLKDDEECQRILSDLNIEDLDSVLFILKRPYWYSSNLAEEVIRNGDDRFWYARGIVQEFLDELWKVSIAPIDDTRTQLLDFRGREETINLLYQYVPSKEKLRELAEKIGEPSRFFKYLESTYIADLIDEVRINVKHRDVDGNMNFTQLSEGEQQLLTVLGLMRFTKEDESLFLLDEPDTHLNPIWKLRYFDEIEKVVKLQDQTAMGDSQLIVTTHDPIMVGSLRKEQVQVLKKENGKIVVINPEEHPRGMGVAGLLKSEYFGLPSTLDSDTLAKLHARNELLAKRKKSELFPKEEVELARLTEYLDDLGFSKVSRDPDYQLFIEKMYQVRSLPLDKLLTADELAEREARAEEIVKAIVISERDEELSGLAKELKLQTEEPNA